MDLVHVLQTLHQFELHKVVDLQEGNVKCKLALSSIIAWKVITGLWMGHMHGMPNTGTKSTPKILSLFTKAVF